MRSAIQAEARSKQVVASGNRLDRKSMIMANPKRPITIDGMPAKRSTPKLIEDLHREMVAYSERKTPAEIPTGTAIAHEIKTRKAVPTIAGQTPSQTGIPLKIAS
jgi:hypothetical protein